MLTWMLYVLANTLLLSGAALAAERAARLRRARTRWIWGVTIMASLGIPVIIASVSVQVPSLLTPTAARRVVALRELTSVQVVPLTWVHEHTRNVVAARGENWLLQRSWIAVSVTLLVALALNVAYVNWCKRRWKMGTVAGSRVYIARDVGPAVVGLLRSRIVVPEWLLEGPPSRQAIAVDHEKAHLAGHDPQLLTVALCLVVLMPWNLPLWWQLLRLRYAIEVDCDARVLASGLDARLCEEMLIAVSERPSAYIGAVAAMSEPRSSLKERITLMVRNPAKRGSVAMVAFGSLALALVAVAMQITPPNFDSTFGTRRPPMLEPAVLDRYVGYYLLGGSHVVFIVTHDGGRLFLKIPLYDPGELVADSDGTFVATGQLPITFVQDAQGQTTGFLMHVGTKFTEPWVRIDATTAQTMLAELDAKYRNQTPTPGSEAALRRVLDGVLAGTPNYNEMTPQLAESVKHSITSNTDFKHYVGMGAVRSIQFRGVGRCRCDVYEVHQEAGTSTWSISMDANGLIEGVGFHRW
jgi:bla regulator protein blaR1